MRHKPARKHRMPFLSRVVSPLLGPLGAATWHCWLWMPAAVRIRAYRSLATLGRYLYGSSSSLKVQRLLFGLYLKKNSLTWRDGLVYEYGALDLTRRYTSFHVARPLDLVSGLHKSYLLTSRVPGVSLGMCINTLSDPELDRLIEGLGAFLAEPRAIPRSEECSAGTAASISNSIGKACHDHRINAALGSDDQDHGDFVGPFPSETEFNNALRCAALPDVVHHDRHRIVFTHGDLYMRNILVEEDGTLVGMVDWENSGWYSEYWEYTKAHYITKLHKRFLGAVGRVFQGLGPFERELETERALWNYCF